MKRREGNEAAAASPVVASPPAAAGAQRASGREARRGSGRTDGLLRGAERFDQGKQQRRRAGAAAPDELPHGRVERGEEGTITLIQPTIK